MGLRCVLTILFPGSLVGAGPVVSSSAVWTLLLLEFLYECVGKSSLTVHAMLIWARGVCVITHLMLVLLVEADCESENHFGSQRPLGSLSPTVNPTLACESGS